MGVFVTGEKCQC